MKTTITKSILSFTLLLLLNTAVNATNKNSMVAPPSNDLIANAIDLNYGPLAYSEANVNFPEATFPTDGASAGCNQVSAGIWYKFYATKNGNVSAFIQTNNGAIVTFYSANNGNVTNANQLTYVNQPSNLCALGNLSQIDATTDTYYYIFMRNISVSTIAINVSNAFASPENDWIGLASEVAINNSPSTYEDIHFLTATNILDGGQIGCDTEEIPGIWYKFYSEGSLSVNATLSSPANTSAIIFYLSNYEDSANTSDLEHVAQTSNPCGIQNTASIETEPDNWYYIFASTLEPYANVTINASVLNTEENHFEGFSYYPNPVGNELILSTKYTIDQVSIFNLMGQKVYAEKINNTKSILNLSFLQQGMYVMTVTSEGTSATYKVVKQ